VAQTVAAWHTVRISVTISHLEYFVYLVIFAAALGGQWMSAFQFTMHSSDRHSSYSTHIQRRK
jgi:hypothetical protein